MSGITCGIGQWGWIRTPALAALTYGYGRVAIRLYPVNFIIGEEGVVTICFESPLKEV